MEPKNDIGAVVARLREVRADMEFTLKAEINGSTPVVLKRQHGAAGYGALLSLAYHLVDTLADAGWQIAIDDGNDDMPFDRCGFDTRPVDACSKVTVRYWIEGCKVTDVFGGVQ